MSESSRVGRRSVRLALALALGVVAGSAGCSPPAPAGRMVTTDQMLGESLATVYTAIGYRPDGRLPTALGLVLQDISTAVANRPPDPSPGADVSDWAVLVACYQPSPGQLTLGVVRIRDVPADGASRARQRGYDGFVGGCAGSVPTFQVLPPPSE